MTTTIFAQKLVSELGLEYPLAEKVVRMFTTEQLAAATLNDLIAVLGCSTKSATQILSYARILTGVNKPAAAVATSKLPEDSVAAMYALIGKTVVAWVGAKLVGPHIVQVGPTHIWVQLVGIKLQMSCTRPLGSTTKMLVGDPSSLYEFLHEAGELYWYLSAREILETLIEFANSHG